MEPFAFFKKCVANAYAESVDCETAIENAVAFLQTIVSGAQHG